MTQNVDRETVVSRLLGTDDILILCHKNPDGDTIGSSAALCKALQHLGKTAAVLCSDPIPAMYDYMQITVYDGSFTPAFVVAVDVAGIQLFGDHNNIQDYAEHVDLCIDHHGSNTGWTRESLVDASAAAACELIAQGLPFEQVTQRLWLYHQHTHGVGGHPRRLPAHLPGRFQAQGRGRIAQSQQVRRYIGGDGVHHLSVPGKGRIKPSEHRHQEP